MTEDEKKAILAGAVRNNMTTSTIFTPWDGLDLTYRDEMLCRTTAGSGQQNVVAIASQWDLHDMDDDTIWQVVMEGKPVPSTEEAKPEGKRKKK